ncbi:uncharacterized protein [Amphiura filiformis]|uniref:uncharacterized protein n=1 Tax=Amphiura filiformis TaxID=82378 RepID=UPI003B227758
MNMNSTTSASSVSGAVPQVVTIATSAASAGSANVSTATRATASVDCGVNDRDDVLIQGAIGEAFEMGAGNIEMQGGPPMPENRDQFIQQQEVAQEADAVFPGNLTEVASTWVVGDSIVKWASGQRVGLPATRGR